MFDRGGKLAMSNDKGPKMRLAMVVTSTFLVVISIPFPVAAFIQEIIRNVQPTAEFLFTVMAANVWNWITPFCVYILLHILILALGVQSGVLTTRPSTVFVKAEGEAYWKSDVDVAVEHTHESEIQTHMTDIKASEESSIMKEVDHLQPKLSGGLYCKKSRRTLMRRSTTGLSNLSRETTNAQKKLNPHLRSMRESVVFEICAEADDHTEEDQKVLRHEVNLSSEELYAKAESFIGNFYRELKMQRENSWKRLCNIYKQSC